MMDIILLIYEISNASEQCRCVTSVFWCVFSLCGKTFLHDFICEIMMQHEKLNQWSTINGFGTKSIKRLDTKKGMINEKC